MLTRRTPLRRKTPLRSRSLTKKYALRDRDRDYLDFIRWCKCCLHDASEFACSGRVEADHAGPRPKGQKCDDTEAIPLCTTHHRHRTGTINRAGHFKEWTKQQIREWCDRQIRFYRNLYKNLVNMGKTPWRRQP